MIPLLCLRKASPLSDRPLMPGRFLLIGPLCRRPSGAVATLCLREAIGPVCRGRFRSAQNPWEQAIPHLCRRPSGAMSNLCLRKAATFWG